MIEEMRSLKRWRVNMFSITTLLHIPATFFTLFSLLIILSFNSLHNAMKGSIRVANSSTSCARILLIFTRQVRTAKHKITHSTTVPQYHSTTIANTHTQTCIHTHTQMHTPEYMKKFVLETKAMKKSCVILA
jgi:hypothetical protein